MISKRSLTPILAVAVIALALLPLRALAANLLNTTVPISFTVFDSAQAKFWPVQAPRMRQSTRRSPAAAASISTYILTSMPPQRGRSAVIAMS